MICSPPVNQQQYDLTGWQMIEVHTPQCYLGSVTCQRHIYVCFNMALFLLFVFLAIYNEITNLLYMQLCVNYDTNRTKQCLATEAVTNLQPLELY